MGLLMRLANEISPNSLANRFRKRRFSFFIELIKTLPPPIRVLDAGGTPEFWEQMGAIPGLSIVLLNLEKAQTSLPNFTSVVGDAADMTLFKDKEFDVVFSNSVIEHVGDYDRQAKMVREMMRVGKRYFVQTPNCYFPLEPHFLFPYFQFLPVACKVFLLRHFKTGWYTKKPTREDAVRAAESIRLLTWKDLHNLFPDAEFRREKVCGLTKSMIAYGGWR
jgi:hypothetical protein